MGGFELGPPVDEALPGPNRAGRRSCEARKTCFIAAGLENFTVTEVYFMERVSVAPLSTPLTAETLLFNCEEIANIVDQVSLAAY
jgi:hypothetical protein